MLIKYITILFINILLFLNNSVKADVQNYIVGNNQEKISQRIDNFFIEYPNEKRVFWVPEINGKSRYAFSIRKNAYIFSKKYADASDLYYLSEKIDEGLKFELNKSKQIDISLLKSNFNVTYRQRHLSGIKTGVFLEKKDNSFGMFLNKDFIIFKNTIANFGFKQAKDKYIVFDAKFVKLSNNEVSEFYCNLNHEFKSDILNMGIGHTWFEIANQYDLTVGIEEQDKKIVSNLYATFGDERMKFQIGFDQIKNSSDMNVFFNLKLENNLEKKKFKTNIFITSKENISSLRNFSLKSFREKNLDMLWKKYMNYN
jgi:hypothetical protein